MAENISQPLNTESLPQQIMAQSESTISSSTAEQVLRATSLPQTITTTMGSLQGTNVVISNVRTIEVSEEITPSERPLNDNETISVSTQVNIITEESMSADYGGQAILHTSTGHALEEETMEDGSESVNIPQTTIGLVSESGAVISRDEDHLHAQMSPSLSSHLPPWGARLRDCELIGDSYRGYVTNEVELDLILTLHKQHTNSCWGTRQSPSSAKPSIRLMWKSQYVPYDGIPFLNTGRRATVMECQYGPRRKGCTNKKSTEYDSQGNTLKKTHRPTCPARIYIKKVRKFPQYRIDLGLNLEGKNVRQAQERALTHLRLAGVENGGEERFYVQLPLPIAHEYHDIEDIPLAPSPENQGQRLNQQVADKINEFVARGVTGVYTIKHCLKEYVEKELCVGQDAPPRHNKAFFPTIIDLQNHIHQAQVALASGTLLPLPPLNNLPIIPSLSTKERVRKRKAPEKQSQMSQTIQHLQTAEAVASIQDVDQMEQDCQSSNSGVNHSGLNQDGDENIQGRLENLDGSEGQQILITHGQTDNARNGQVVIVVTSNNVFNGQESDTPNTFALTSLPSSHITNIPSSTFGTLSSGNQAVLIAQHGENGQFLAQTQSGNILTVMNPSVHGGAETEGVVLRMMASPGLQTTANPSAPEQLLASQAAVEAVLNAAATVEHSSEVQQILTHENQIVSGIDGIPLKRRAIGIDLSSLVKEAGFDTQVQDSRVELTGETTPSTASILYTQSSDVSAATQHLDPSEYTNHGSDSTLFRYHSTDGSKPTNQDAGDTQQQSTGTQQESASDTNQQSFHDQNSLQHETVDVRQLQPVTMETIENLSMSGKSSSEQTAIDITMAQPGQNNGMAQQTVEQLDAGMVLVED